MSSAFWQKPRLAGQQRSVTLWARQVQPSGPLVSTQAACLRDQGAKMAVKVTPPLPPPLA